MKIQIASDLHFEFFRDKGLDFVQDFNQEKAHYLFLAGDIILLGNYEAFLPTLRELSRQYKQVFYTYGNHEYYDAPLSKVKEFPKKHKIDNLVVLNNETYQLPKKLEVFGGTLWFPDNPLNQMYERQLTDFRVIEDYRNWVYKRHKQTRKWLEKNLHSNSILMTHHLGAMKSTPSRFAGSDLNRFYNGDIEDILLEKQPKLHIHGHTHDSADYYIDKTHVICNPLGYVNYEQNPKFNKKLVLDL